MVDPNIRSTIKTIFNQLRNKHARPTNPYYQQEQWKQRREQKEGQNVTGKTLMLAGGPLLIASLILLFA